MNPWRPCDTEPIPDLCPLVVSRGVLRRLGFALLLSSLLLFLVSCTDAGMLEAELEPESDITVGFVIDLENQKSAGFHVCTRGPEVNLVEVEPIEIVGEVEFLGAFLLAGGDEPIGSANGFPPEGYDDFLQPINDASVSLECGTHPPSEFA